MRDISCEEITRTVRDLCIQANCHLPVDVQEAIVKAEGSERSPVGKAILGDLEENFRFADARELPICQDTGMAVVFVELGQEVHITGGLLSDAVNAGVAQGYVEGHLRCSVVGDPLRRVNTNNNTPAIIHLTLVEGDRLSITVAPKGFGSENMTALRMLKPSVGPEAVVDFIVEAVSNAGSNPCPPIVVGVGVGGTSEMATLLAKRALLRPVDQHNEDPFYADLEAKALARINALGIGPQGLGGTTTALSVCILHYGTHIAGLPCAVNIGCHVTRHASAVL
ncbi:fumarate hydratase [Pseudoflavonifractor sp. DSM 107456]|uniref:Fumarate hydratase n=2 Tax=Pseudoflavonifractor TaxID=1017280 RepID=A0ABR9R8F1_9FIRM|nr:MULTISPECIES: fumarate hydratase [Pseudoflavonifractor]MBC5729565.1 fumarate hydratase [Pseudoflavonifractor hominis]MBE5054969.1 fumarate hydratase [Pseudoflavonifractor gallinarum]MBT9685067.1 fumarate hydratase [Pseudoflavonifractor sp. MCC625]